MWGIFDGNKHSRLQRIVSFIDDRTKNLLEWTKYFHHKHEEHDRRLEDIEKKLTLLPSESDIKHLIDMHYLNHDVRSRLNTLHSRVNQISMTHEHMPLRIKVLNEKIKTLADKHSLLHDKHEKLSILHNQLLKKSSLTTENEPVKKSHFKEKLMVDLAKNSKNYVKNNIVNLLKKYGSLNGSKIKEMIVEEQKLCSKSSLYRILSEIEKEYKNLIVIRQGKDKLFSFETITQEL